MADENIKQVMQDAILDADSLERFINGDDTQDVLTRLSAEYPTLQKALKELFENGGIAARFKTLVELQASSLVDGDYALVADDTDDNNGIYIKEGGAWVKSKYNPISQFTYLLNTELKKYDLGINYSTFLDIAQDGTTRSSRDANYKNLRVDVVGGSYIEVNAADVKGVPAFVVYASDDTVISEHDELSAVQKMPENAAYVVINCRTPSHASYDPTTKDNFYVTRTAKNPSELDAKIATLSSSVDDINTQLDYLANGESIVFRLADFTESGISATYKRTPEIPVKTGNYVIVSVQGISDTYACRGYKADGSFVDLMPSPTTGNALQYNGFEVPSEIVEVQASTRAASHGSYFSSLEPFVVVGKDRSAAIKKASELLSVLNSTDFSKNRHYDGSSIQYDSTEFIRVLPDVSISYKVDGKAASYRYFDSVSREVTNSFSNKGVLSFDSFGYVEFATPNSEYPTYNPDLNPFVDISYPSDELDISKILNSLPKSYNPSSLYPSPRLRAIRELEFADGTQKLAVQYLWEDSEGKFYLSNSKKGEKQYIFTYDEQKFQGVRSHHYSMNFDKLGNIVCVFRIEQLQATYSDDNRKNPIVLIKDDNYKPVVVDFGDKKKPSGWLQSGGFICTDDAIFIAEYTRPSVETANTWKATYPLTDANNWKTVQTFELSPEFAPPDNLKHIHMVDIDPYTGFIYTSTGDSDAGSAFYVSTDGGDTFQTILQGSEKHCRMLNFIFTEDWVYWATDSTATRHWFFKVARKPDGVIDTDNIIEVEQFPWETYATYATVYMPSINALLFLDRADGGTEKLPMYVWDLKNDKFTKLIDLPSSDSRALKVGFRCECVELYPRGNELIVGFTEALGGGGYANKIGLFGNSFDDPSKRINNLIIRVDRMGGDFNISFDTVF